MKRIPNKIAISNVLAGITGKQRVKIVDYENEYDLYNDQNRIVVFDGEEIETYSYKYSRYTDAKYLGMIIENGVIVLQTFTKFEQYK